MYNDNIYIKNNPRYLFLYKYTFCFTGSILLKIFTLMRNQADIDL